MAFRSLRFLGIKNQVCNFLCEIACLVLEGFSSFYGFILYCLKSYILIIVNLQV